MIDINNTVLNLKDSNQELKEKWNKIIDVIAAISDVIDSFDEVNIVDYKHDKDKINVLESIKHDTILDEEDSNKKMIDEWLAELKSTCEFSTISEQKIPIVTIHLDGEKNNPIYINSRYQLKDFYGNIYGFNSNQTAAQLKDWTKKNIINYKVDFISSYVKECEKMYLISYDDLIC